MTEVFSLSYLCSYVSALRNYLSNSILDANNNKKSKKKLFKLRPTQVKNSPIRNINALLIFLWNMLTDTDMNIPRKIECLFMLLSGIRVNTIVHLKITNMYLTDSECTFVFDELLKHSRPFNKLKPISFGAFPQNPKLSAITALMQYLNIRLLRSSDTALSITTVKQNHTKEHLKIILIVR